MRVPPSLGPWGWWARVARGDGGHGELAIWRRGGHGELAALLLPLLLVGVRRRIILFLTHHVRARLASPSRFHQRHVDVRPPTLHAFVALGPF